MKCETQKAGLPLFTRIGPRKPQCPTRFGQYRHWDIKLSDIVWHHPLWDSFKVAFAIEFCQSPNVFAVAPSYSQATESISNKFLGEQIRQYTRPSWWWARAQDTGRSWNEITGGEKPEKRNLLPKQKQTFFRCGIGKLLHIMRWSRLEVMNRVRECSKYMGGAVMAHIAAMKRAMRYVVATPNQGLTLNLLDDGMDQKIMSL